MFPAAPRCQLADDARSTSATPKRGRAMSDSSKRRKDRARDSNADPITGAPGAHPVGTIAGAASGAAAGAAVGTVVGGPVGLAAGGVVGAVVGGLTGKGVAEAVNPTAEDAYWRANFGSRSYAKDAKATYASYQPAYRAGWEARGKYVGRQWSEVESDLRSSWESARGTSKLAWSDARGAAHDAWDHVTK